MCVIVINHHADKEQGSFSSRVGLLAELVVFTYMFSHLLPSAVHFYF